MKKFIAEKQPAREVQVLKEFTCDLCGEPGNVGNRTWTGDIYRVEEIIISYRSGISYPECGRGTELEVDMCPSCFKHKFIPWVKSQGGEARETEWD